MSDDNLILYTTEDGRSRIELRTIDGTAWMTQAQMAELFQTSPQAMTQQISSIYEEQELNEEATCKELLQVRTEGNRTVSRALKHYNLDMILAVGYRVRSARGVQFRRWATTTLTEYLIKGFVIDDIRLKQPGYDYFDELLERIRDIRASEARFYQKVRDILALSEDYDPNLKSVNTFYATIQNKMLHAVTGYTAAELIVARADATAPNMGLTSWKGARVRKGDVVTAKNYLAQPEISELNLIVTMFLDTADLRARRRQSMHLVEWETVLDNFLQSNELNILKNAGSVSHKQATKIAEAHYESFDEARKEAAHLEDAKTDEVDELKRIADEMKKGGKDKV
ncbi:virulence RhuM family protein [Brucella oryzae]|uniref:Hydroxyacid dehydrogenase n=1 Tax=Brucella oryzae TaxID=335286 RepID=A0A2S7J1A1_9HYPH|nr:virulence RhuM family protein [Brucella oryzae]PQA74037.1 hydroxyacid dehydrogenase [Brucella oryzae]